MYHFLLVHNCGELNGYEYHLERGRVVTLSTQYIPDYSNRLMQRKRDIKTKELITDHCYVDCQGCMDHVMKQTQRSIKNCCVTIIINVVVLCYLCTVSLL